MARRNPACLRCTAYDKQARQCIHRKANPPKELDAVELVEHLGLQALCTQNPFRDQIAARMLGIRLPTPGTSRLDSAQSISVDILPDDSSPDEHTP